MLRNVSLTDIPMDLFMEYFNADSLKNKEPILVPKKRIPYKYTLKTSYIGNRIESTYYSRNTNFFNFYDKENNRLEDSETVKFNSTPIPFKSTYLQNLAMSETELKESIEEKYNKSYQIQFKTNMGNKFNSEDGDNTVAYGRSEEDMRFEIRSASDSDYKQVYIFDFQNLSPAIQNFLKEICNYNEINFSEISNASWETFYPYTGILFEKNDGNFYFSNKTYSYQVLENKIDPETNEEIQQSVTKNLLRYDLFREVTPVLEGESTTLRFDGFEGDYSNISIREITEEENKKLLLSDNLLPSVRKITETDKAGMFFPFLKDTDNFFIILVKNPLASEIKYSNNGKELYLDEDGNEVEEIQNDSKFMYHYNLFSSGETGKYVEDLLPTLTKTENGQQVPRIREILYFQENGRDTFVAFNKLKYQKIFRKISASDIDTTKIIRGNHLNSSIVKKLLAADTVETTEEKYKFHNFYDSSYPLINVQMDKFTASEMEDLDDGIYEFSNISYKTVKEESGKEKQEVERKRYLTRIQNKKLTFFFADASEDEKSYLNFSDGDILGMYGSRFFTTNSEGKLILNKTKTETYYSEDFQIFYSITEKIDFDNESEVIFPNDSILNFAEKEHLNLREDSDFWENFYKTTAVYIGIFILKINATEAERRARENLNNFLRQALDAYDPNNENLVTSLAAAGLNFIALISAFSFMEKDKLFSYLKNNPNLFFSTNYNGKLLADSGAFKRQINQTVFNLSTNKLKNFDRRNISLFSTSNIHEMYVIADGIYELLKNELETTSNYVPSAFLITPDEIDEKIYISKDNQKEDLSDKIQIVDYKKLVNEKRNILENKYRTTNVFERLTRYEGFPLISQQLEVEAEVNAGFQSCAKSGEAVIFNRDREIFNFQERDNRVELSKYKDRLIDDIVGLFYHGDKKFISDFEKFLKPKIEEKKINGNLSPVIKVPNNKFFPELSIFSAKQVSGNELAGNMLFDKIKEKVGLIKKEQEGTGD